MNAREQRAEEILATGRIARQGHISGCRVSPASRPLLVMLEGENDPSCDCDDFELRQLPCKHILAVQMMLEREKNGEPLPELAEVPPKVKRPTYPQKWAEYNLAQTNEKDHFQCLLCDLLRTVPPPAPRRHEQRDRPLLGACSPLCSRSIPPSPLFGGLCATWKKPATRTHRASTALQQRLELSGQPRHEADPI